MRTGAAARALENQVYTVHSPCVGPAPFCTACETNTGMAGIFAPPDKGFPPNGVIALGEMNTPQWVTAKVDLDLLATPAARVVCAPISIGSSSPAFPNCRPPPWSTCGDSERTRDMTLPQRLLDGYASFRSGRYAEESERYARLGTGAQKPAVMIIACCDSRAAPETIFDAGPGEIFVMRNVANLVPPYAP